uniref:Reverse transcriptase Ty1/copia-type domain-containing protein n=1 Tax=Oryza brachyantha TaxID=4533 RepID=J3MK33_ORYBR
MDKINLRITKFLSHALCVQLVQLIRIPITGRKFLDDLVIAKKNRAKYGEGAKMNKKKKGKYISIDEEDIGSADDIDSSSHGSPTYAESGDSNSPSVDIPNDEDDAQENNTKCAEGYQCLNRYNQRVLMHGLLHLFSCSHVQSNFNLFTFTGLHGVGSINMKFTLEKIMRLKFYHVYLLKTKDEGLCYIKVYRAENEFPIKYAPSTSRKEPILSAESFVLIEYNDQTHEEHNILATQNSKRQRITKSFGDDYIVYLVDATPRTMEETTFLSKELDEKIYMDQPDRHLLEGQQGMVCKLFKCLYGLKISDVDKMKATSGYVFTLRGGSALWKSYKHTMLAKSTMKTELTALDTAAINAEWLCEILMISPCRY